MAHGARLRGGAVLFVVVGFGGCSVLTAYNSLVEQGGTGVTVTPLDPDANDLDDVADAATHDAQEPLGTTVRSS